MEHFFAAMNARRLDLLDELVAPDFIRHCQATPLLAIQSLDQFKDFLREYSAAFPDNVQTITQNVAEGDRVAIWGTYEGTQLDALGTLPATGRRVIFEFGAIARVWRTVSSRSGG